MQRTISHLEPNAVWSYFEDICQIPRPSKKEEKIIAFLKDFAQKNDLPFKTDEIGNVLISKPATPGYENLKTVVLQSHLDMVCEKNSDVEFNFETDAIQPQIAGEWVKATGTTLGADCGIGIASEMAILTSNDIKHGPVECLFTVDEETGLSGAFALQPGFFEGKILLNLDSEDEGELFIGCAGGIDTIATLHPTFTSDLSGLFPIEIKVSGLLGGHSGDDINKGRANANKILVRFLLQAIQKYEIQIATFNGGNLRNAIAREASATLLVKSKWKENIVADFNVFKIEIENEFTLEKAMKLELSSTDFPETAITKESTANVLNTFIACPHGVHTMSIKMPGMVETSTNLASIKMDAGKILVTTSQRSDIESGKQEIASMVKAVFELAGADVRHTDGYPGWAPNPNSPILETTVAAYEKLFDHKPLVRSIHAGLECGLFLEKYPNLDMVSFGPTIKDAHSPDEKININSVQKFWVHLIEVLENIEDN